jgi:GPH family glycoside/pentoside/hexuronide:cation symporter
VAHIHTQDRTAKLSVGEKLGYGVGDFGFNLYWTTIASFLAAFYTDTFGISAAAAGTMLLATKIIDACTDPVMGAIADRTNTRWGKFRPYLLWAGLPMAGAAVLTFTTPDLGETGKIIWAYVTFTLMMVLYTVLSTPYSALSGVMTARSQERTSLISIRFIFAFGCGFIVNYLTLKLVSALGNGNDARGWQITMLIYGLVAAAIFAITFFTTRERIAPPPTQKTNPIEDIKDLLRNRPWLILFALAMIIMMTITMRAGSAYYYFTYYVERPDLLGLYLGLQAAAYALGAALAPLMTRFLDKAKLLMVLMAVVGVVSLIFTFVPKPDANGVVTVSGDAETVLRAEDLLGERYEEGGQYQWVSYEPAWWIFRQQVDITGGVEPEFIVPVGEERAYSVRQIGGSGTVDSGALPWEIAVMFLLNILVSIALGPKSPLTWSMYADAADYNEWRNGRRATAMTFSAATFSQKLGGALGSAIMLWVLAAIGYEAKQAQTGASQQGIVLLQTLVPGLFALAAVLVTRFYNLTGETLDKIQLELKQRQDLRTPVT